VIYSLQNLIDCDIVVTRKSYRHSWSLAYWMRR